MKTMCPTATGYHHNGFVQPIDALGHMCPYIMCPQRRLKQNLLETFCIVTIHCYDISLPYIVTMYRYYSFTLYLDSDP